MREILFRGKRKDNGKWIESKSIVNYKNHFKASVVLGEKLMFNGNMRFVEVNPKTVGQYTGLTDKNSKRIFEGDIVRDDESGYEYVIKWFPEYACYALADKHGNMAFDVDEIEMFLNDLVVVDNIHDNHELLEQEG